MKHLGYHNITNIFTIHAIMSAATKWSDMPRREHLMAKLMMSFHLWWWYFDRLLYDRDLSHLNISIRSTRWMSYYQADTKVMSCWLISIVKMADEMAINRLRGEAVTSTWRTFYARSESAGEPPFRVAWAPWHYWAVTSALTLGHCWRARQISASVLRRDTINFATERMKYHSR